MKAWILMVLAAWSAATIACGFAGDLQSSFDIDYCQERAFQAASQSGTKAVTDVPCDLRRKAWLVALPASQVTRETLAATGMPEAAVLSLSQRDKLQTELVFVQEPSSPTYRDGDRVELVLSPVHTKLRVGKVFAVNATVVVLSVSKTDDGGAVLLDLRPRP